MKAIDQMTYPELVFAREGHYGPITPEQREEIRTCIAMQRLAWACDGRGDMAMPKIWNGERRHMNPALADKYAPDREIALQSDPTFLRYIAVHWTLTDAQRVFLIEMADEVELARPMSTLATSAG